MTYEDLDLYLNMIAETKIRLEVKKDSEEDKQLNKMAELAIYRYHNQETI
jgi:hypothetical protein